MYSSCALHETANGRGRCCSAPDAHLGWQVKLTLSSLPLLGGAALPGQGDAVGGEVDVPGVGQVIREVGHGPLACKGKIRNAMRGLFDRTAVWKAVRLCNLLLPGTAARRWAKTFRVSHVAPCIGTF